jgi:carotene biosynthesis associated membrane protein
MPSSIESSRQLQENTLEENVNLVFQFAFWLFVASICFSIAGMLLLRLFPSTMGLFGPVYTKLVKTPTWTFMTMLAILPVLMYGSSLGYWRLGGFIVWGCAVGAASELIGTTGLLSIGNVSLPFGEYQYTQWLGPKIAGHVPYFIPPSWFAMALVSMDLARRVTKARWGAVLLGAVFMVIWDVSLDPAMNEAFPFWQYAADGFFFGMPFSNWCGWFGVTLIIMIGYEWMRGEDEIQNDWAPLLYGLNCFFPICISLLRDLYLAAFIGVAATAIPLVLLWMADPAFITRSWAAVRS